jgi:hypothetical protein
MNYSRPTIYSGPCQPALDNGPHYLADFLSLPIGSQILRDCLVATISLLEAFLDQSQKQLFQDPGFLQFIANVFKLLLIFKQGSALVNHLLALLGELQLCCQSVA